MSENFIISLILDGMVFFVKKLVRNFIFYIFLLSKKLIDLVKM